jgi:DNA-binding response OmpR family regulator
LLVVDDDEILRRVMAAALRNAGYEVVEAADGVEAMELLERRTPSLVLLDITMPRMNGWRALEALRDRAYRGGVIMLTGGAETDTIVRALSSGADDVVGKPFELRELLARVNAVLRRAHGSAEHGVLRLGAVRIDLASRTAEKGGVPLRLSQIEFKLLEQLKAARGRAVPREELLRRTWGYSSVARTRTVDTHVWRLRTKICDDPHHPEWIRTVPGGYRLVDDCAIRGPAAPAA